MSELKLYITLRLGDNAFSDDNYDRLMGVVHDAVERLSEAIGGELTDLEIK